MLSASSGTDLSSPFIAPINVASLTPPFWSVACGAGINAAPRCMSSSASECETRTSSSSPLRCCQCGRCERAAATLFPPHRAEKHGTTDLPGWATPAAPCRRCTARAAAAGPGFAAGQSPGSKTPAHVQHYISGKRHRVYVHGAGFRFSFFDLRLGLQRREFVAEGQLHDDVSHQTVPAAKLLHFSLA